MIDSGCSRHVTGDASLFLKLGNKASGSVRFANKKSTKVIGKGCIGKKNAIQIKNVLLVDGVKFNLSSVSQLCDNDFDVCFSKKKCSIVHKLSSLVIECFRENNAYYVDFDLIDEHFICMSAIKDDVSL